MGDNGILWDIDLDFLTRRGKVRGHKYTPLLSDHEIAQLFNPRQEWLREVFRNLRGISIALEPKYTGGLTRSLHLFQQWEKAFFRKPLFDKECSWRAEAEQQ